MTTEGQKRAAHSGEARLETDRQHFHFRANVRGCGARALLAIEPRLGEFFTRDFLDEQFRRLVNDVTVFFAANHEAGARYSPCDLHRVARRHAEKLLSAGRFNRVGKGI